MGRRWRQYRRDRASGRPPWWVWFEPPAWLPGWAHRVVCTFCRGMGKRVSWEWVRWQVAFTLNRLPGQCWADLTGWALDWDRRKRATWWPWRPIDATCRADGAANSGCYCGKLPGEPTTTGDGQQGEVLL